MNIPRSLVSGLIAVTALAPFAHAQLRLTNPDNTVQGRFGAAVAIAGSRVLVGAPAASVGGVACGAVYVFNGFSGNYEGRVSLTTPVVGDRFGESIAVVGTRVFIGSPGRLQNGLSSGRVYYVDLPFVGNQLTNNFVSAEDATSNSNFGTSVAVNSNFLLVGAPGADSGLGRGKAYLFANPQGLPVFMNKFTSTVTEQNGGFGQTVAVAGSTRLVIGAPLFPEVGSQSGIGYVFNPGTNPPTQLRKLRPSGVGPFSQFGASIAVQGSTALLGAPDEEAGSGTINVGSVYVVNIDNGSLVQKIQPASIGTSGRLGTSVAFSGSYAVAGAPYASKSALEAGAFFLFNPFSPGEPLPIAPGGLNESARFGAAIALRPPLIAVGAPEANISGASKAGSVYIYRLDVPGPSITPKPKKVTASGTKVLIKGSASGGFAGIARVEYAIKRSGGYKPLNGTTSWRGKAKIKSNTSTIFVRSVDSAGYLSAIAKIKVRH